MSWHFGKSPYTGLYNIIIEQHRMYIYNKFVYLNLMNSKLCLIKSVFEGSPRLQIRAKIYIGLTEASCSLNNRQHEQTTTAVCPLSVPSCITGRNKKSLGLLVFVLSESFITRSFGSCLSAMKHTRLVRSIENAFLASAVNHVMPWLQVSSLWVPSSKCERLSRQ